MGLDPDVFWRLTVREFWIKHAAFHRAEHRQRALVYEIAGLIGQHDKRSKAAIKRNENRLRRYPVKKWLRPEHS